MQGSSSKIKVGEFVWEHAEVALRIVVESRIQVAVESVKPHASISPSSTTRNTAGNYDHHSEHGQDKRGPTMWS